MIEQHDELENARQILKRLAKFRLPAQPSEGELEDWQNEFMDLKEDAGAAVSAIERERYLVPTNARINRVKQEGGARR